MLCNPLKKWLMSSKLEFFHILTFWGFAMVGRFEAETFN